MTLSKNVEKMIDSEISNDVNPFLITMLKESIENSKKDVVNARINELTKTKEDRTEFENSDKNDPRFDHKKIDCPIELLVLDIYTCGLDYFSHALKEPYCYNGGLYPKPTTEDALFLSKLMAATKHPMGICEFARFVKGADIELLEKALIETGDIAHLLSFAEKVKKLDFDQRIEYIVQNCSPNHIKYYERKAKSMRIYYPNEPGTENFEHMKRYYTREMNELPSKIKETTNDEQIDL